MSTILTLVEHSKGQLKASSLAAINVARQAATAASADVLLLVIGDDTAAAAAEASAYGDVLTATGAHLGPYLAEEWAPVITRAARDCGARLVLATATSLTKDCMPRAAALLDAGMASEISAFVGIDGGTVTIKRPMWAGNVTGTAEVSGPLALLTVRATEFDAAPPAASSGTVSALDAGGSEGGSRFVGFNAASSGTRPDPTEARIVVAGGRGFKAGENFAMLEQLADLLQAGIGASRAACDAGWVPNDWQIGQTGKVVAPDLYIAIGISGAIQHLAGMKGSKTIVAINKDPEAPIFQVADYGLVADLFQALPELMAALG